MIGDIITIAVNGLIALGIYGGLALAYTILSAYANINIYEINKSFDRKKWLNGLAKYGLLGAAVLITLVGSYAAITLSSSWGVELANAQQISAPVIYAVLLAGIAGMAIKNIAEIANILNVKKDLLEKIKQTAVDTPADKPLILDVADLPQGVSSTAAEQALEESLVSKTVAEILDEVGGRGAVASVSTTDWGSFRNAVIGRAYDIDGYYGAQCWDGAALFWLNAVGRSFSTGGTGAARGGWEAARAANAGSEFELITDRNAIKAGDWLVFGGTQWGHVGMAVSGNLGGYVKLLGQNQGGNGNGSPFNEINMNLGSFLGAFRLKRWNVAPAPKPTPTPTPTPAPSGQKKAVDDAVINAVIKGSYGNGADRKINLERAGYDPNDVQAAVNARLAGKKTTPAPSNNSTIKYTYRSGDTFGQVILNLGLNTSKGLWGADGDVAYYTAQLNSQGIYGNIPVGREITLVRR